VFRRRGLADTVLAAYRACWRAASSMWQIVQRIESLQTERGRADTQCLSWASGVMGDRLGIGVERIELDA